MNLDVPSTAIGSLAISGNGILNLNGTLQINFAQPGNDPVASIIGYLHSGYNHGSWTGTAGIISTTAATGAPLLSLGYADGNLDPNTAAGPNQLLVMLTKNGDANLDGAVDISDLNLVAANYGLTGGARWAQGDFDYDGDVDLNDLNLLLANFSLPAPGTVVFADAALEGDSQAMSVLQSDGFVVDVVPEPGVLGLVGVLGAMAISRRRRFRFSDEDSRRKRRG
jgi:hypothetical protein